MNESSKIKSDLATLSAAKARPITALYITGLVALLATDCVRANEASWTTATLYVGRHFEIRDHDQPTKYVFNGETRVAEITGSLSNNSRLQRLHLQPGWNLCSLAVSGPLETIGDSASDDRILAVFEWD